MKKTILNALIDAISATAYIALVAWIMYTSRGWVGPGPEKGIVVPIAFLLLFVVSASVMALTVFGRPIMWYLDGKKSEAVRLAIYTVACMIIFAIIALACIIS